MPLFEQFSNLLWTWILPVLLVITAFSCGTATKFQPFGRFRKLLCSDFRPQQRRIVAGALAATMGTGNLIGTAAAICIGGAGNRFGGRTNAVLPVLAGLAACALAFIVLRGGTEKIGDTALWLMPLIFFLYLAGCLILLIQNAVNLPNALSRICREAFRFSAISGGFCGSMLRKSCSVGLRRGIFSNEAGLGTSALLHMNADSETTYQQGIWVAFELFADTALSCTLTALVLLTAPHLQISPAADLAALLLSAFSQGLGTYAGAFLALTMALLAFATLIGWFPCGAAAFQILFPRKCDIYLSLYLLAGFIGALQPAAWIFILCDCCSGCMAIPNLAALLVLRNELKTEAYHEN